MNVALEDGTTINLRGTPPTETRPDPSVVIEMMNERSNFRAVWSAIDADMVADALAKAITEAKDE